MRSISCNLLATAPDEPDWSDMVIVSVIGGDIMSLRREISSIKTLHDNLYVLTDRYRSRNR